MSSIAFEKGKKNTQRSAIGEGKNSFRNEDDEMDSIPLYVVAVLENVDQ